MIRSLGLGGVMIGPNGEGEAQQVLIVPVSGRAQQGVVGLWVREKL